MADNTTASSWHQMEAGQVTAQLTTDLESGLTVREAERRLAEVGPNVLASAEKVPWWKMLLAQFQDFMVLVLLVATAISYAMGETADAITIVVIVVVNAVLGFIQEYRAEQSLEALKQLAAPTARLRRDGQEVQVAAADLVPGDILLLEAGDKLPADARLAEAVGLEVEEAALTGESLPVRKNPAWAGAEDAGLGDRKNMVYMGTTITRGRGTGVVVATGMTTEMGRIANLMQEVEQEETPLQKRLEQLGKWLVLICLAVCALVVVVGLLTTSQLTREDITRLFLSGVSLAVAAIPEGLPAIVTVALALGVQRMIKRNAIVRKLQAVETLGCATVVCSDKTGTLTKNEMMVRAAWAGGKAYDVTGDGYRPVGDFLLKGQSIRPLEEPGLTYALKSATICNNSHLVQGAGKRKSVLKKDAPGSGWTIQGDPTEGALVVAAVKAGYRADKLSQGALRIVEVPFESERRRMSVVVRPEQGDALELHLKGAPDTVLELSTHVLIDGRAVPLTQELREAILAANDRMAGQALRVLGIAFRALPERVSLSADANPDTVAELYEKDLIFLGLFGMIDPPRPEVKKAVAAATRAGMRTVMITGDHPSTALAVARELGITGADGRAVTGRELNAMSDEELVEAVHTVKVFARVSPQHKLRIVRAFKQLGEIVAMTGDGVNDAPAVKEADIGVAMGRTGTDVTKEASAMILSDDNFATIIAAVEEGRGIYDNIRKFIRYLLSCNTGEVLVMFFAALMRLPLPLLPIQILFVNLVTDGLPAMALGVEPPEPDVMRRPPRRPDEGVFARRLGIKIIGRGFLIGLGTLGAFVVGLLTATGTPGMLPLQDPLVLERARTMALATLVSAQLIHVFDCRSERRTIFETGLFGNPWLVGAVLSSLTALLLAIYWTPMSTVFGTAQLNMREWVVILGFASVGEMAVALRRFLMFGRPVRMRRSAEEET
ncbi:MAG TPA: cation-translocating P-type ATPase [Symbiobacteriaceae bacterium]|nr:cation-translocating P-type ATPase [Symbiobacteriaceae bacterium]